LNISLLFRKFGCFKIISANIMPDWESFHTHTHGMSWVIYLKFLSAGKLMLIEYLTLTYIFAYFWFAIWLSYQLFIHVCFEANLGKTIISTNFPLFSSFQCEASGQTYSCVRMCAAQKSGWFSDMSGHAQSCWLLI
jgi:hypothetical protein